MSFQCTSFLPITLILASDPTTESSYDFPPVGQEGHCFFIYCSRVEASAFLESRGLDQFCTTNSIKFFKILGLSEAFSLKDPATWCDDELHNPVMNFDIVTS